MSEPPNTMVRALRDLARPMRRRTPTQRCAAYADWRGVCDFARPMRRRTPTQSCAGYADWRGLSDFARPMQLCTANVTLRRLMRLLRRRGLEGPQGVVPQQVRQALVGARY